MEFVSLLTCDRMCYMNEHTSNICLPFVFSIVTALKNRDKAHSFCCLFWILFIFIWSIDITISTIVGFWEWSNQFWKCFFKWIAKGNLILLRKFVRITWMLSHHIWISNSTLTLNQKKSYQLIHFMFIFSEMNELLFAIFFCYCLHSMVRTKHWAVSGCVSAFKKYCTLASESQINNNNICIEK